MSRGISANTLRSGACGLTMKIEARVTAFGLGSTRINLANSGLMDIDMPELVEALVHAPYLSALILPGNGVANEGAKSLTLLLQSRTLPLAELDLGRNLIGNSGASALAEALRHNYTLTSLALDHNPIRLSGMQALLATMAANRFCAVTLPAFVPLNQAEQEAEQHTRNMLPNNVAAAVHRE